MRHLFSAFFDVYCFDCLYLFFGKVLAWIRYETAGKLGFGTTTWEAFWEYDGWLNRSIEGWVVTGQRKSALEKRFLPGGGGKGRVGPAVLRVYECMKEHVIAFY